MGTLQAELTGKPAAEDFDEHLYLTGWRLLSTEIERLVLARSNWLERIGQMHQIWLKLNKVIKVVYLSGCMNIYLRKRFGNRNCISPLEILGFSAAVITDD